MVRVFGRRPCRRGRQAAFALPRRVAKLPLFFQSPLARFCHEAEGWRADLTDEQILERLLALNLERAAEEAKAQGSPKRKSAQRGKTEHELI